MNIIHGTWIPKTENNFIQTGGFYLWVETSSLKKSKKNKQENIHPRHLTKDDLSTFLISELGLSETRSHKMTDKIDTRYFILPSANNQPFPSLELSRYLEVEIPDTVELHYWGIDCYAISNIIKSLSNIHFIVLSNATDIQLGTDFIFWYHYTQFFKQIILKDQYIPALKYREIAPTPTQRKGKRQKITHPFEIYPGWQIISGQYEANFRKAIDTMPFVCVAGNETLNDTMAFYDKEMLLRHFSECLLTEIVTHTSLPAVFDKKIVNSLVYGCVHPDQAEQPFKTAQVFEEYKQWLSWQQKLIGAQIRVTFYLCFQLQEAAANDIDNWHLNFLAISKKDPSFQMTLNDYWDLDLKEKKSMQVHFGKNFEKDLLLSLGYAARMYPKIWQGLETDKPISLCLTLEDAFDFLKESAWILEDADYKVIIPAWWTPEGRKRAKIRIKTSSHPKSAAEKGAKSYFDFDTLIQYRYELAIGGQVVTEKEWQQLVNAKTPLVQFRGQWMELDRDKMQQMLEFWQTHSAENPEMTLLDLMKKATEESDDIEVEHDKALAEMVAKLQDNNKLKPTKNPPKLKGTLREYQKRGVSWLQYLEKLGLNGCLADDMGLGKTVQVIALLLWEPKTKHRTPTLLITPTSVVGNWQKEIEKFAPHLKAMVHHGNNRAKDEKAFKKAISKYDIIITSFSIARKDTKFFNSITWQRIVLDEAQNIKNPKTAQTKAILKLKTSHRLALTGTPIENRLLDLWSIFNFLNPGYLGKESQFRKSFEMPIQRDNDRVQSGILKKLVEPFILRRVKTDKNIIKDLPDKVEHKQYCNLTKEQASLYEAVVKDVEKQIEEVEGIQRKGLILSTLIKLKQICNHPMQFLHDGSAFLPERSHKLERLTEMLEEVIAEGESFLIFTQFTDIGENLEKHLKLVMHYNTYYLHGGTNRKKREKMITEFQNPETEPSAFILSLKAGGVGITLTKANHVFHFDRWWNPAVEDQATDRAFRIGQQKNVFVHKFVTLGTLEERIDQMIEDKKKVANMVVGSDESWLTELDNESFKALITLNQEAVVE
ncbi:DEAD/DEAH box helicase [Candidatus Parabeggiatoa sp. HSG14]|uniref:DEAD/DEAH box helicase n=1 Tax=Candidatus Parabeggiatoa sp. HSG14 TaxID=3055593 RepID=UPI0025A7FFDD|nr:DEAD/DEAH box helicase [Thiotrichales bacterium HSG14]